uniref:Integrase catalytic domain-containing protein n=1 Tax=Oryza glaberrima TaxID=4538 RepID=I1Q2D3_ORYGL
MSSSYHPQTDGQTERLNQCLEAYLRCTVYSCPTQWSQWLSQAQFGYNTSFHSALGKTPYEVLFARKASHFGLTDLGQSTVPDIQVWL